MKTKKKPTDKSNYYVDPDQLKEEIRKSKENNFICTEELGKMLILIGKAVLNFPKYKNLPKDIKSELLSYSMFRFVKCGIKTVQVDKNCFAYITEAFKMNCLGRLMQINEKHQKEMEFKAACYRAVGMKYQELGWTPENPEDIPEFDRVTYK